MNEEIKKGLQEIEDQLYAINSRNISLRWIGMRQKPTDRDIRELNALLGYIIKEIRVLKDTGKLNSDEVHKICFPELYGKDE